MAEKDYVTHFRPEEYLQMYYSTPDGNSGEPEGAQTFQSDSFHDFYLKYHPQWDTGSAKLLEFGGGPVISRLISGAPHFKEVVFAAHTKEERREVCKWRDNEQDAGCHNWENFFRYVVNTLEQKPDTVWKERESMLRSRMKKIIACDIKEKDPLETGEHKEEFDVIQTSLCLEVACHSYDEYKTAVGKLSSMLKRGGFMVVVAVEEETFYYVGERKWFCLSLSLSQIKEAFEDAGLEIVETKRLPTPPETSPTVSDYKAMLFLAAKKKT